MKNKSVIYILAGVVIYSFGIITGYTIPDNLLSIRKLQLEPFSVSFDPEAKETSCFEYENSRGWESYVSAYEVVWDGNTGYARLAQDCSDTKVYYESVPDMSGYTSDAYARNLKTAHNAYLVLICNRDNGSSIPVSCEMLCTVFFNNRWYEVPMRDPDSGSYVITYDYAKKLELVD